MSCGKFCIFKMAEISTMYGFDYYYFYQTYNYFVACVHSAGRPEGQYVFALALFVCACEYVCVCECVCVCVSECVCACALWMSILFSGGQVMTIDESALWVVVHM